MCAQPFGELGLSIVTIVIYIAVMLVVAIFLNLGGWWITIRLLNRFGRRLRFASFVAIRHLRGRKSGFLTAIGVLSILGVSFSSCTLTTVLSVMGGFSEDLKGKILKTNEVTCHIPIILLTAKAENKDRISGLETGADIYITKPFVENDLCIRI